MTEIRKGNTAKKIAYEGQTHNANYTIVNGTPRSGNPINWYNGSLYTNLTWTQGRRLTSLNKGGATFSFTYDMDGIRSSKTANGATHNYITQNGKVVRETVSSNATNYTLDFIYDAGGSPFAMIYTNSGGVKTTFYYVLNAQGDVVSLINEYGTQQASYTYDAWGALLSSQSYNSNYPYLHNVNPLRYRGYYYDDETGWYYLQSRYYDPIVKRFINLDFWFTDCPNILNFNLFVYCGNSPTNNYDPQGKCYFDSRGIWKHDYWEFTPGYVRRPDPRIDTNPQNTVVLNDKITGYMHENVEKLKAYEKEHGRAEAVTYFLLNVRGGGPLDIKLQDEWKFEDGKTYVYLDQVLRYDDPGNINYGYVGAVLFPEEVLCAGAGGYQVGSAIWALIDGNPNTTPPTMGGISTYFDDPRDTEMIRWGYKLYIGGK